MAESKNNCFVKLNIPENRPVTPNLARKGQSARYSRHWMCKIKAQSRYCGTLSQRDETFDEEHGLTGNLLQESNMPTATDRAESSIVLYTANFLVQSLRRGLLEQSIRASLKLIPEMSEVEIVQLRTLSERLSLGRVKPSLA
ncbi:hypothetical protein DFH06DRAFT_1129561 [Mycena polygramma]|nr:hypothetical protein DFH06DRAFT_1129561 [Mycena polygramma]